MMFARKIDQVFCLRLDTTAFLQGWFGVVSSLFWLLFTPASLPRLNHAIDQNKYIHDRSYVAVIYTWIMFRSLVSLVAHLSLLYGAVYERYLFIIPWLFNRAISIIVCLIYCLILVVAAFYHIFAFRIYEASGIIVVVALLGLYTAFLWYVWNGIYCLFCHIRDTKDMRQQILPFKAVHSNEVAYIVPTNNLL